MVACLIDEIACPAHPMPSAPNQRISSMSRFAANLSLMFQEYDFLDRFAAAKQSGFQAVEFLFPYAYPAHEIVKRLEENQLELALFNLPPGDWDAGERGLSIYPERRGEFQATVGMALQYAQLLKVKQLHVMAGNIRSGEDLAAMRRTYIDNLRKTAQSAAEHDITLLIEPLNPRDMPGYFLRTCSQAAQIITEVGEPNLKLQFDMYHVQITEGDVTTRLKEWIHLIGHVQIAGVPGRHEPDQGELHYPWLLSLLNDMGYKGFVGCEYRPAGRTEDGLAWMNRH
jgi:hydroxypyruvate isomerase